MKRQPCVIVVAFLGCCFAGCGSAGNNGGSAKDRPEDEKHIAQIIWLFNDYQKATKKSPASADELKAYANKLKPDALAQLNIKDVNQVFISPRDRQPYVIVANVPRNRQEAIIVYEKEGVNGKRMTGSSMGGVAEVDDKELHEAIGKAP